MQIHSDNIWTLVKKNGVSDDNFAEERYSAKIWEVETKIRFIVLS